LQLPLVVGRADAEPLRFLQSTLATPESGTHLVQFYTPADDATRAAILRLTVREGAAYQSGTIPHPPSP
jgi:hypothetical protein